MNYMMTLPREVLLIVVFQTLSFLKIKHNGVAGFDPDDPEIGQTQFPTEDWSTTSCGLFREDSTSNALVSL